MKHNAVPQSGKHPQLLCGRLSSSWGTTSDIDSLALVWAVLDRRLPWLARTVLPGHDQ
jgi:hypothetical protein